VAVLLDSFVTARAEKESEQKVSKIFSKLGVSLQILNQLDLEV
jgi:hypothetical protein